MDQVEDNEGQLKVSIRSDHGSLVISKQNDGSTSDGRWRAIFDNEAWQRPIKIILYQQSERVIRLSQLPLKLEIWYSSDFSSVDSTSPTASRNIHDNQERWSSCRATKCTCQLEPNLTRTGCWMSYDWKLRFFPGENYSSLGPWPSPFPLHQLGGIIQIYRFANCVVAVR